MTREAQSEHEPGQSDAAAQATAAAQQSQDLPPRLHAQILQMTPADAGALAELLQLHPALADRILSVAAPHMGNSAVQRALAIANGSKPQGRQAPLSTAEMHEMLDDPAPASRTVPKKAPLSTAEMHEMLDDPAAGSQTTAPKKAPLSTAEMHEMLDDPAPGPSHMAPKTELAAPRPAQVATAPAWVAEARAYNAAHPDLVDRFNELTSDVARLDGAGDVDPQAVAHWQRSHHVSADGKIGPHTIEAAKAGQSMAHRQNRRQPSDA